MQRAKDSVAAGARRRREHAAERHHTAKESADLRQATRYTQPMSRADSKGDLWKVFAYFLLSEKVGARPGLRGKLKIRRI